MKKLTKTYKLILFLFILIFLIFLNFSEIRNFVRSNLSHDHKVLIKEIFFGKKYLDEISFYKKLGYNRFQIPQTQFIDLNFKKISLNDLKGVETHYNIIFNQKQTVNKFFLENIDDGLLIASANGEFKFSSDYSFNNFEKINSNLNELNIFELVDISKIENQIYVSFVIKKDNEDCIYLGIANAEMNRKIFYLKIFKENECTYETNGLGGRIYPYTFQEKRVF